MKLVLYVATFLGGVLGLLILLSTFTAEGAAVAMACVVIPYCMARVLGESHKERLLERLTLPQAPNSQSAVRPASAVAPNSQWQGR